MATSTTVGFVQSNPCPAPSPFPEDSHSGTPSEGGMAALQCSWDFFNTCLEVFQAGKEKICSCGAQGQTGTPEAPSVGWVCSGPPDPI